MEKNLKNIIKIFSSGNRKQKKNIIYASLLDKSFDKLTRNLLHSTFTFQLLCF